MTTYGTVNLDDGHILIIDDQEVLRNHIRRVLGSSGSFTKFTEAADGLEGFQKLLQQLDSIDVIICDVEMPQIDGFKFLGLKQSKPELVEVPVIMVTTRGESEHRLRGLQLGASDYVLKPFDDAELLARATIQLKIKRMLATLRRQARELEQLSNTDPLTKVNNRRYLMQEMEKEMSRAQRKGGDLTVVMCDIDYFKKINDTYGHLVGDSVLQEVARVLQSCARDHDVLARYGGEEFCLVLPETAIEAGITVAERCRTRIADKPFQAGGEKIDVRMSFGVASLADSRVTHMDELLRRADVALYRAKEGGRNRTVRYLHRDA